MRRANMPKMSGYTSFERCRARVWLLRGGPRGRRAESIYVSIIEMRDDGYDGTRSIRT